MAVVGISLGVEGKLPQPSFVKAKNRAAQRVARDLLGEARKRQANHVVTGEMMAGTHTRVLPGGSVELYNTTEQAWFIEYGTDPHVIEASPGGVLRWYNAAGAPVFATRVQHPGTEADPFMWPALYENAGKYLMVYADELEEEL